MKAVVFALLFCIVTLSSAAKEVHHASEAQTQSLSELRAYWTRDRIESAIPLDVLEIDGSPTPIEERLAQLVEGVEEPVPVFVEAQDSLLFPTEDDEYVEPIPAVQSKRAYPFPYTAGYAPSYTTDPWRRVGKVFFSQGGGNYVCSGAVISKYVVATAGHCVYDAQSTKTFVTNFMFVPGYNNNVRPYGTWSAQQLFTSNDWATGAKFGRDYGFAVLKKNNGLGVGDVVGTLGYVVNLNAVVGQHTFRSLGYPAASPFNGQTMYWTEGTLGVLDTNGGTNNPATMGLGSDATGGTSGGPWVYGWGVGNQLVSVNSYKYSTQPAALYGPQFDSLWDTTRASAFAITPP